ncbi:MAG TPA: hypothetical protein V6C81_26040 [Planktothrix sp.]|jgi:hypothetical protein
MLLADTMAWVFAILGLMLAFPGLWLLCRGVWPGIVEASTSDTSKGLLIPFFCGLPQAGLTVLFMNLASKLPGPFSGMAPIAVLCLSILFASTGVAGLVTTIGHRLPSKADEGAPWRATIRGGVVLELSYLLPFLGWFVILPSSLIIGAGCALRANIVKFKKRKPKITAPRLEPRTDITLDGTVGA